MERLGKRRAFAFTDVFQLPTLRPDGQGLRIRTRRDRPQATRQSGLYAWYHPRWGIFYVGIAAANNYTERWNKHIQKLLDQCRTAKQMRNWAEFSRLWKAAGMFIDDLADVWLITWPRPHPGTVEFKQDLLDLEARLRHRLNPRANSEYDADRPSWTHLPAEPDEP